MNKNNLNQNKFTKEYFMDLALNLAKKALKKGDVPVGAIIVDKNNNIISKAFNKKEKSQNAIRHAEILAIDKACKKLKSFRLEGLTMFVTLEPCPMCSGAIIASRLDKVIFGAYDKNYGCAGSKYNFLQDKTFEHLVEVEGGVCENECSKIIKDFFVEIRNRNKTKKRYKKPNNLTR